MLAFHARVPCPACLGNYRDNSCSEGSNLKIQQIPTFIISCQYGLIEIRLSSTLGSTCDCQEEVRRAVLEATRRSSQVSGGY